jgi:hypothetical protein
MTRIGRRTDYLIVLAGGGNGDGRTGTANEVNGEQVRGPFFAGAAEWSSGDFAVHFTFEVTPKATGRRTTLEEVGVYTVKDDKITRGAVLLRR